MKQIAKETNIQALRKISSLFKTNSYEADCQRDQYSGIAKNIQPF